MYVMRREPDSIEYPNSSLRAMAGGTTQEQVAPLQSFSFPLVTDRKFETKKSPLPGGGAIIDVRRQDKMRLASRLVPPPHAAHPPGRLHPALRSRCVHAAAPPFATMQKMCIT